MYYRIERTYLTNAAGDSEQEHDKVPYFVAAGSASAAASAFVSDDRGRLLGGVSTFPGDKATATAWSNGRLYILFVQRGAEALQGEIGARDSPRR